MDYGLGAVFGCPAHDQRDLDFANKYNLKIIEDYSDLDASTVADDIAEKSEDTPTLLDNYIEELETDLEKSRLKKLMKSLYTEAGDLEIW